MTYKAYAKLNLMLDIIRKREDGYHDISSVMQTIDLHDVIDIDVKPSSENAIKVSCENAGDFSSIKWDESNLVYKAAALMLNKAAGKTGPVAVYISVRKNIPDGAGMGGGSADAAAVLEGLNVLLSMDLSTEELCRIGAKLGADVPFCLLKGTALCEGIGEKLTSLPSPGRIPCIVLKPQVSLSTKEMYRLTDTYIDTSPHPVTKVLTDALKARNSEALFSSCGNFMERAAVSICPEIEELKQSLEDAGAKVAMMTGSGSAVFGLFSDEESAKKAFEVMKPSKAKKFISFFYGG